MLLSGGYTGYSISSLSIRYQDVFNWFFKIRLSYNIILSSIYPCNPCPFTCNYYAIGCVLYCLYVLCVYLFLGIIYLAWDTSHIWLNTGTHSEYNMSDKRKWASHKLPGKAQQLETYVIYVFKLGWAPRVIIIIKMRLVNEPIVCLGHSLTP